jgi:hypothetical protein
MSKTFPKQLVFLFLYPTLFYGLASCSAANQSNKTVPAVEITDSCQLDSENTYEVYIPERDKSVEKLPLLLIIDSHGSGQFALNKFKHSANQYPAILVASNLVKNGFEGYEAAIQTLVEDVRCKYPVEKTIFVTGFSGGARMALGYALAHPVNGLILCGALAGADQIRATQCPVVSISGMDDFNFMETAQYLFQEQSIPGNLKMELTDASHSWPDSLMLANALGFLRLSCQAAEIPSPSKSQLKTYCQNQQARIHSLKQHGDFLKAALVARNMASTDPFNRDETFASTYNELKANPDYLNQMNQLKTNLNFEISVRQPYLEAFRTKDTLWWKNEIRTAEEKIKTEKNSYTKDTYRRIKGFWGIASYSLCKQAIKEQNAEALNQILSIYRMLEPANPDMLYFSSFPYFWKQNKEATLSMLKKALEAGYSDMGQLKKDFPESITLRVLQKN